MAGHYTILYRSTKSFNEPALIVEDERGVTYLFLAGTLQVQAAGQGAGERIVTLLGGELCWNAVPRVAPYRLEDLHRLFTGEHENADGAATGTDDLDGASRPFPHLRILPTKA